MTAVAPPLRVLFYVQNLSGAGHYVRTLEIARAASRRHLVWMLDGGRSVPRTATGQVRMLPIPRIRRRDGSLAPLDAQQTIEQVMAQRRLALADIIGQVRPQVIVVEHYPFSKWELDAEIDAMLHCAHAADPALKVICSVRDIVPQTRNQTCNPPIHPADVLQRLHGSFDGLMVHADPELSKLEDFFPLTRQIRIPVAYTGIVAEEIVPLANGQPPVSERINHDRLVIASAGGGLDAAGLLENVAAAWRMLKRDGKLDGYRLVLFGGLDTGKDATLTALPHDASISHLAFSPDYLHWMQACELSISCAGYNTVANILRSGCRAILVPNRQMSDQIARTRIMQELGIGSFPELPGVEAMAAAILQQLEQPAPRYAVNLTGADRSAAFITALAA